MAQWVRSTDMTNYVNISQIVDVFVRPDIDQNLQPTGTWNIVCTTCEPNSGGTRILKTGFASQAAAQTALDAGIITLGGSI